MIYIYVNNEKENLLNLFSQQETSYKSSIDLNHKETSKLKELLRKTLETKSALEAKVKSLESSLQESIECIDSLKAEGSKLIASFQEQIQEKDYLLTSSVQESDLKINLLQTSVTTLENQINSDRLEFENKYSEFTKEQKSLQDSLKIAEERLKLKEEEIFEIKENYEAQLEDLLTEEEKESLQKPDMLRIIPLDGAKSSSNASFKHDDEKKRYNLKIRELQEKVHNLWDKLQQKRKYLIN